MSKQTKKQNRKMKTHKTKKRHHRKQRGGNNEDELNMIVREESLDALKEYVEQGGDVNKKGSKGITALMEATAIFNVPKVNYLLQQGADVNAVADDGTTAYSYAYGNDELVDILKDAGANTEPAYLLLLAIGANNETSAKTMINSRIALGLDVNEQVHYETIELEDGTSYNVYEYPLLLAIKTDNYPIVEQLLKEAEASLGIVSDITRQEVYSARSDDSEIIYDDQETPIILAAKFGELDMVKLLLEENIKRSEPQYRFDINRQSIKRNVTPLYIATHRGHADIAKELINAGASLDSFNGEEDYTALMLAAEDGDLEMVELLVESGASVDILNSVEVDAAYIAYDNNHFEIVKYLADQGHSGAQALLEQIENDFLDRLANEDEDIMPPPPPEEEPEKKDTTIVVQQIQPEPIEHQPQDKPVPEILQTPNLAFYDVIDMEEKQVQAFLDEDPDNIIFVYKQQIVGTNKQQLQNEFTTNRTKIMLECKEPNTYFHQPEENLVKDNEDNLLYYLNMDIVGLLGILLPISQLKTLTSDDSARMFIVDTSEDLKVARAITSFGAYDGDNVVSAKHCAEEEPMKIGKVYSVDFPLRKEAVKRTRSKSPTKNKTRKVRKQHKSP